MIESHNSIKKVQIKVKKNPERIAWTQEGQRLTCQQGSSIQQVCIIENRNQYSAKMLLC